MKRCWRTEATFLPPCLCCGSWPLLCPLGVLDKDRGRRSGGYLYHRVCQSCCHADAGLIRVSCFHGDCGRSLPVLHRRMFFFFFFLFCMMIIFLESLSQLRVYSVLNQNGLSPLGTTLAGCLSVTWCLCSHALRPV